VEAEEDKLPPLVPGSGSIEEMSCAIDALLQIDLPLCHSHRAGMEAKALEGAGHVCDLPIRCKLSPEQIIAD
jgi:hypothetical protein